MKARWMGLTAGIFALAITAAPAAARMHGHGAPGSAVGIPMPIILHSANLTPAQHEQIHQIMKSEFGTLKPLFQQLHAGRQAVAAKYLSAGSVSASDLTPLVAANEKTQSQIDQAFVQTALKVRAVLTPQQIAQAGSIDSQMQSLHEQMHALMSKGGAHPMDSPPRAND
ncbi:MAG TPA: periplasmic heavy metal sensor [Candidatus Binataceae bacterium]|nr:periplasmic heavy metal sensor [Candidatus Binataceae bacterium]